MANLDELYKTYVLARKYAWKAHDEHGPDSVEYQKAVKKEQECYYAYFEARGKKEGHGKIE